MVTERERIEHVNDIHRVVLILLAQLPQYLHLLLRLTMEPLLVPHHLQGDMLLLLVIVRLYNLAERTFTDHLQHLVPVGHVIMGHVDVGTMLVVVAVVVRPADYPWPLLRVRPDEIYVAIIENLVVLVRRQLVHVDLQHDVRCGDDGLRLADTAAAGTSVRTSILHH